MKYIITGAAIAWALYMADKYLFFSIHNNLQLYYHYETLYGNFYTLQQHQHQLAL